MIFFQAKNKIFFVSPYKKWTLKKWPYPKIFFHDLEIKNIFFLFTKIYTFSLKGLFFITLLFFHTILLQNSKLNTVLDI